MPFGIPYRRRYRLPCPSLGEKATRRPLRLALEKFPEDGHISSVATLFHGDGFIVPDSGNCQWTS